MLKNKHLISLKDLSKDDIIQILDLADVLKKEKQNDVYRNDLSNKSLAIILNKPSTRTKISFSLAEKRLPESSSATSSGPFNSPFPNHVNFVNS